MRPLPSWTYGTVWPLGSSLSARRPAENLPLSQQRHRAVLAHHDDQRRRIVVAVTACRGMARASQRIDRILGVRTGNQADAELAEDSGTVEHRGTVDLAQCVLQRGEVKGSPDPQRRRDGEPLFD